MKKQEQAKLASRTIGVFAYAVIKTMKERDLPIPADAEAIAAKDVTDQELFGALAALQLTNMKVE